MRKDSTFGGVIDDLNLLNLIHLGIKGLLVVTVRILHLRVVLLIGEQFIRILFWWRPIVI